jgi:hypothetical protein
MEQKQLSKKEIIDGLLDVYNDYMDLFNFFGDKEYYDVTQLVVKHLTNISSGQPIKL